MKRPDSAAFADGAWALLLAIGLLLYAAQGRHRLLTSDRMRPITERRQVAIS